jgi:hypothetical protein
MNDKKQEVAAYDQELANLMHADAGMGVSTDAKDVLVPSINVLQPLSPEVLDGPDHVDGAHPGDFLLANTEILDGKKGFLFQPCGTTEWWFEFIPRESGGGFVNRYPVFYHNNRIVPPEGAEQVPNKLRWFFPATGNNCTHYKFVAGVMWRDGIGLEYVIPFFSTGHTAVRQWATKWMRKRFPDDNSIMPAFSHVYRLTTNRRTNKQGTWFSIETDDGLPLMVINAGQLGVNVAAKKVVGDVMKAYHMGRALATAFHTGEKVEELHRDHTEGDEEMPF